MAKEKKIKVKNEIKKDEIKKVKNIPEEDTEDTEDIEDISEEELNEDIDSYIFDESDNTEDEEDESLGGLAEDEGHTEKKVLDIVKKAKEKGNITYGELATELGEVNPEEIDKVFDAFEELGVNVLQDSLEEPHIEA